MEYFQTNFRLFKIHNIPLETIENMIPWEREVYLNLLKQHIAEEIEKAQQRNG